jgi:predicted PurR-regulated permease PerM
MCQKALAFTLTNRPEKIVRVVHGLIAIQLSKINLPFPRIQANIMRSHALFILPASVFGTSLIGLVGFRFAVPVVATTIELLMYFKQSL